jgi:hypothetical protein
MRMPVASRLTKLYSFEKLCGDSGEAELIFIPNGTADRDEKYRTILHPRRNPMRKRLPLR